MMLRRRLGRACKEREMSLARVHFQCMHFVRILASNVMVVAGGLCFIMLHFMHIMHN